MAELNGVPVHADELQTLALTNFGHFTTMRVEAGRVRGSPCTWHDWSATAGRSSTPTSTPSGYGRTRGGPRPPTRSP